MLDDCSNSRNSSQNRYQALNSITMLCITTLPPDRRACKDRNYTSQADRPWTVFWLGTEVSGETSFTQVELKAQSICDFINSPLISNQIAGRRNYCRLPPVSVIFANVDIYFSHTQCRDDHIG